MKNDNNDIIKQLELTAERLEKVIMENKQALKQIRKEIKKTYRRLENEKIRED